MDSSQENEWKEKVIYTDGKEHKDHKIIKDTKGNSGHSQKS